MARKYVQDYRLDNVLTTGGRLKTVPVYVGDWYEFEASEGAIRKTKLRYGVYAAVAVLSLVWLLLFTNHMRTESSSGWYVVVPAAISILFLFFACLSIYRLFTAKGPVTREHKDKTHDRMAAMSLVLMILSGLCVCGCVYHLIAVERGFWQILYTVYAGIYFASALLMFLHKGELTMKLSDKPKTQIPDM